MPVVVGRVAAHAVRPSSHSMHCDQLQVVMTELPTRVLMQEPAFAVLIIGTATPARIAIAKTSLTIPNTPSYRAGLPLLWSVRPVQRFVYLRQRFVRRCQR